MRLVVLDWDGVVLDNRKAVIAATRAALDTFNIHWKWSDDAAYHLRGVSAFSTPERAFRALVAISIGYADLDAILQQENPVEEIQLVMDSFLTQDYEEMAKGAAAEYLKIRRTKENFALEKPFPWSKEAIGLLSKKFRLAVVSNQKKAIIKDHMQSFDAGMFSAVIAAEDVRAPKPDPDGILKACAAAGVPPEEAAVIGDSVMDIWAAKAAGCRAIGVLSGISRRQDLQKEGVDAISENLLEAARELCR